MNFKRVFNSFNDFSDFDKEYIREITESTLFMKVLSISIRLQYSGISVKKASYSRN